MGKDVDLKTKTLMKSYQRTRKAFILKTCRQNYWNKVARVGSSERKGRQVYTVRIAVKN